jgi:radical SAM-linked protein
VINKNISAADIMGTVENAFSLGWQVIKLYFMVGLPTEDQADLQAIVELIRELRQVKGPKGQKGKLNVSVASFIPKPHTPFQWSPQASLAESREKIDWLRSNLKFPGIQFKWQNPDVSQIEGLMARGDRRLSTLLIEARQRGCKFDGWSDQFRFADWRAAMEHCGIDPVTYNQRERNVDELLPWDHIDQRIDKKYLVQEWHKALRGDTTTDCRMASCNQCGVCDFVRIEPKLCSSPGGSAWDKIGKMPGVGDTPAYRKLQLIYSKTGPARFFGHLEMVRIILRALNRAGIPLKFSEGYHPMPKVSFGNPLPLGMESHREALFLSAPESVDPHTLPSALNRHLPDGLKVLECGIFQPGGAHTPKQSTEYEVTIKDGIFDENRIKSFFNSTQATLLRTSRNGKEKTVDLKEAVMRMRKIDDTQLMMCLKEGAGHTVRPLEVIANVFGFRAEQMQAARVVKLN